MNIGIRPAMLRATAIDRITSLIMRRIISAAGSGTHCAAA